ncbi:MAG: APC family permease [Candidatus Eremiobacteraeota bacterium]|nr:APC family permease [Candidatus Eremiobacteraeota bacterium]
MQEERLRSGSLSFIEVLAASVALIGLTMTPVLIAPYMFAAAGNASCLAYIFGAVMMLLVAVCLNHFARRTTASGSMFLYAAKELGPVAGTLAGWSMLWAYVFVGAAQFGAQPLFLSQLGDALGVHVPVLIPMLLLAAICWMLAARDIALSTIVMLALESVSVLIICVLIAAVLLHHGPHVDAAQLHLAGAGKASIGLGIATAIFSFVGFESASAFGDEAKSALRTIPRAIVWSVVIASAFFVLSMYTEILGLRASKTPLDRLSNPLQTLADLSGVAYLKIPITIGAIFSSFSVALACVNTAARVILPMAQSGLLPPRLATINARYKTPKTALAAVVVIMFAIGTFMFLRGVAPIDIFNFCGTLSSLSFIAIYLLIVIAAPRYLRRCGELRVVDIIVAAAASLCLIGTAITLFYPAPPPPTQYFPYAFFAYLALGLVLYRFARRRITMPAADVAGAAIVKTI